MLLSFQSKSTKVTCDSQVEIWHIYFEQVVNVSDLSPNFICETHVDFERYENKER